MSSTAVPPDPASSSVPSQQRQTALERIVAEQFPVKLRPEMQKLAALRVVEGKSVREAAFDIGISYNTASMWTRRLDYQAYETWLVDKTVGLNELRNSAAPQRPVEKVRERFEEHALEMQDRLLAILETSNDNKLVASIAHDWLNRAGLAPVTKTEKTQRIVFSDEMLAELDRRAREAGVIDITPVRTEGEADGRPVD